MSIIQESKLRPSDSTPIIDGYSTIRRDRLHTTGGGLLLFIKKDIRIEQLHSIEKAALEILPVRVQINKNKWITISNVYIPNTKTQFTNFDSRLLRASDDTILLGDLNGHSPLWDLSTTPDIRGEEIEDWVFNNDLNILNDGSPTRTSRIDGSTSTPDVSICGRRWTSHTTWKTVTPIGNSDHLPILITINHNITYHPLIPRALGDQILSTGGTSVTTLKKSLTIYHPRPTLPKEFKDLTKFLSLLQKFMLVNQNLNEQRSLG